MVVWVHRFLKYARSSGVRSSTRLNTLADKPLRERYRLAHYVLKRDSPGVKLAREKESTCRGIDSPGATSHPSC